MIIKTLSCTVIYNTHLVTTQKYIYINTSSITQLVFKSTKVKSNANANLIFDPSHK